MVKYSCAKLSNDTTNCHWQVKNEQKYAICGGVNLSKILLSWLLNLIILQYIGILAALLTTLSFAPQAIQIIRTKNTDGISLGMYVLFNAGIALWLVYGIMIVDLPLILANAVTLILTSTILVLKLKHG